MVKNKRRVNAVCSLVLCAILCGCGTSDSEVISIGRDGQEDVLIAGGTAGNTAPDVLDSEYSSGIRTSLVQDGRAEAVSPEIKVYVCGAVVTPGVVALPEGSRAEDALSAAGGFAEDAWRDYVNLAERVADGQKLYFPTLDEAESLVGQEARDGLVNINTADVAMLCTLPGIGESRAKDIIAYREAHGAFGSCEEIMQVSGIKTSVYSKISDKITVK